MPEEVNRVVVDHVASVHFAPTLSSVEHLAGEGIVKNVHLVGDLMVDLVNQTLQQLPERPSVLQRFNLDTRTYGVVTIHRASNTEERQVFEAILEGLKRIDFPIIFPVHPRTAPLLRAATAQGKTNIVACEPLSYADMIALLSHARIVLTDSGGIQKEALTLKVPCVTLRDETEWIETLEDGWNVLAGSDPDRISKYALRQRPAADPRSYYGDGRTARRTAEILLRDPCQRKAIA